MGWGLNGLGHPFRKISGCCYPFEKNLYTFEPLRLSIRKNIHLFEWLRSSVQKNIHPFERLRLSIRKNSHPFQRLTLSVRKKKVIHSNGWGYLFKKKMQLFERLMLSLWKKLQWSERLMLPVWKKNNSIHLFEGLLLSIHTKLISRSIGQRYLMGFRFPNSWDCLFRRDFIQPPEWLCSFKTNIQPFWFEQPRLSILKPREEAWRQKQPLPIFFVCHLLHCTPTNWTKTTLKTCNAGSKGPLDKTFFLSLWKTQTQNITKLNWLTWY